MRPLLLCLLLGVVPGFGKDEPAVATVTLYEKFEQDAPQGVVVALRTELAELMEPFGMQLEWRSLAAAQGSEVVAELAVITFRGRCDAENLAPQSIVPQALGWTHVSDGMILPFSEVDCDRVREFVQKELATNPETVRKTMLGRALARVLAHELYHVFGQTAHHVSCGVAKAAYTVSDLMADSFLFEKLELDLFRKLVTRREATP